MHLPAVLTAVISLHIAFKLLFDEQISVLEDLNDSVNEAGNGVHAFLEFAE